MGALSGRRRIYLMRHGHVDYFAKDLKRPNEARLTEEGRAQARAAGDALSPIAFDFAAHSGLDRARETARLVIDANLKGAPLQAVEGFAELRAPFLTGLTREDLAARLAYVFEGAEEPGATFLPDGESFAGAAARVEAAMGALFARPGWRTALVVAHEGVNRLLLAWATHGGLRSIKAFEQDLGCVNVIDADLAEEAGAPVVLRTLVKAMNVTPYDYVKHGLSRSSLEHLFDVDFGEAPPAPASSAREA